MDQLNSSAVKAWERMSQARYILIITHINADADTISSALALSNLFVEHNIKHKVYNARKNLPRNINFLDRYDKIVHQLPQSYDLAVSVDCGSKDRFGFELPSSIDLVNIDHHISNNDFGTINIVDADKASTAQLVYLIFKANGLKISKQSAQSLYAGIYDDSLAFSTVRCDEDMFKVVQDLISCGADPSFIASSLKRRDSLAKYRILPKVLDSLQLYNEGKVAIIHLEPLWLKQTGANSSDCEVVLDMILNIAVVDIAIFLRQSKDRVRVSLRSKNDVDISVIANAFDGGGHTMAAGCTIHNKTIEETKKILLEYIDGK